MADFAVSPEKNRWLKERMELLGVRESHLEERFIHASGKGGQHVNKSSSCVYLKHLPTGIEVKCMEERSQSLNRFLARRQLLEKLEEASGGVSRKEQKLKKLKRQKERRKRRSSAKYAGEDPPGPAGEARQEVGPVVAEVSAESAGGKG